MTISVTHPAVQERISKWLGVLPAGWSGARLHQVAEAWTSNVDKHTIAGQSAVRLCNYTDVYKNESIVSGLDFMKATATPEQIARFRICHGDTIITKDSETADDIGIPAYVEYEADDLICGYHLAIVRPDPRVVLPRFLYWVMASDAVLGQWNVLAAGVTRVGLRSTDLTKATIPLPPADEQRAIANLLDRETRQIDALIAKQTKLIELLRERRITVITAEALGTGTAVAAEERDIRVWGASLAVENILAGIPAHWRLERFKSMCKIRDERNNQGNEVMLSLTIAGQLVDRVEFGSRQEPAEESIPRYLVARPGDLVINPMWLTGGSIGVTDKRGAVSPDYRVFELHPDFDPWYLHAVLRSTPYFDQYRLYTRANTTFDRRIKQVDLDNLPLPVPPLKEQRKIVARLEEQTSGIDVLIAKAQQHIEFAKERRAALITEAVTGQIDVTGRRGT